MGTTGVRGVGLVIAVAAVAASVADARVEEIRWQQSDMTNVAGFQIHWGLASRSYTSTLDVGARAPDSDGIYRFDITVPDSADVYVAMTAYSASDVQSSLSNERLRAAPAPPPDPVPPAPDPEPEPPAPDPGAAVDVPFRLNAGGPTLSLGGDLWSADDYSIGGIGRGAVSPVSASGNAAMYETFRYGDRQASGFGYEIPVAPGSYRVVLHFVEGFSGAAGDGGRVFDVALEGAPVLTGLDVFASAGFAAGHARSFEVEVRDGALSLLLSRRTDVGPAIAGIEILDAASTPAPPSGAPPGPPLLLSPQ